MVGEGRDSRSKAASGSRLASRHSARIGGASSTGRCSSVGMSSLARSRCFWAASRSPVRTANRLRSAGPPRRHWAFPFQLDLLRRRRGLSPGPARRPRVPGKLRRHAQATSPPTVDKRRLTLAERLPVALIVDPRLRVVSRRRVTTAGDFLLTVLRGLLDRGGRGADGSTRAARRARMRASWLNTQLGDLCGGRRDFFGSTVKGFE